MSKMGLHDPFEYLKDKLYPIVKNFLDFFTCRWLATYRWKVLNEGYNFTLNLTSIGGLHKELWAFKVTKIPI